MSDRVDTVQRQVEEYTAQAVDRVIRALEEPRLYLIVWKDSEGEQHQVAFTGTPAERREYLAEHGIDKGPFAFGHVADVRWDIGGNDPELRQALRKLT